jgi:hypothetical protein
MTMRYASVPALSRWDQHNIGESIGGLREQAVRSEIVGNERTFRMLILAVLNALDLVTTAVVLHLGGSEQNALLAPVVHVWIIPTLLKVGIVAAVWAIVARCPVRSLVAGPILQAVLFFYGYVVVWNTLVMLRA